MPTVPNSPRLGARVLFVFIFANLAFLGYKLLWHLPKHNGSLRAIIVTKKTGVFPDGTLLTEDYTTNQRLDDWLKLSVIFYDKLLQGDNLVYKLLLADVHVTMQATAFCMLASSRSSGCPLMISLIVVALWGILNQAYGAAFVYPLYCAVSLLPDGEYLNRVLQAGKANSLAPVEGKALLILAALGGFLPLTFISPALFGLSTEVRHTVIAAYRLAPVVFVAAFAVTLQITRKLENAKHAGGSGRKNGPESVRAQQKLSTAYLIAGVEAAFVHGCAIATPLMKSPPTEAVARLLQVFAPWSTHVDSATPTVIGDAGHLFLQYDMVIIGLTFVLFGYWLLSSLPAFAEAYAIPGCVRSHVGMKFTSIFMSLAVSTLLLSPGATLCFSLAVSTKSQGETSTRNDLQMESEEKKVRAR